MFALQPDPSFLQQFHRVDSVIFHLEAVANVGGEANLGEKWGSQRVLDEEGQNAC